MGQKQQGSAFEFINQQGYDKDQLWNRVEWLVRLPFHSSTQDCKIHQ
jgi:hypothetical protein